MHKTLFLLSTLLTAQDYLETHKPYYDDMLLQAMIQNIQLIKSHLDNVQKIESLIKIHNTLLHNHLEIGKIISPSTLKEIDTRTQEFFICQQRYIALLAQNACDQKNLDHTQQLRYKFLAFHLHADKRYDELKSIHALYDLETFNHDPLAIQALCDLNTNQGKPSL